MPRCATVTVADILELRADGLTELEVWALLSQSIEALQALFLSGKFPEKAATIWMRGMGRNPGLFIILIRNLERYYLRVLDEYLWFSEWEENFELGSGESSFIWRRTPMYIWARD